MVSYLIFCCQSNIFLFLHYFINIWFHRKIYCIVLYFMVCSFNIPWSSWRTTFWTLCPVCLSFSSLMDCKKKLPVYTGTVAITFHPECDTAFPVRQQAHERHHDCFWSCFNRTLIPIIGDTRYPNFFATSIHLAQFGKGKSVRCKHSAGGVGLTCCILTVTPGREP